MTINRYRVSTSKAALRSFMGLFNIDRRNVLKRTNHLLSVDPHKQSHGISNFPGFEYNEHHWTLIHNVIVVYRISDNTKQVHIDTFYYANTKESHETFWGIDPDAE